MKDQQVWSVVHELEAMEKRTDLPEGLWHIPRETGILFNLILKHSGAKRILEIGTSSGYSTLFLADAARHNSGKVTTCENSSFKLDLARQSFEKPGLSVTVPIGSGDEFTVKLP